MVVTNSAWCSEAVLVYDVLRVYAPGLCYGQQRLRARNLGIAVTVFLSGPSKLMDIPAFR
jgi:hypothetical protein